MSLGLSLKGRIALLSAGLFLILYLLAFAVVLAIDDRNGERDLEILLYAEAEALAAYYAGSGRLDFPELTAADDDTPMEIRLRLIDGGRVVAQTPGLEPLAIQSPEEFQFGALALVEAPSGGQWAAVRHEIWDRPGSYSEALTSTEVLAQRRGKLVLGLCLAGLVFVPLAGLGGRLLATRALRPVDDLVASTRAIDHRNLGARLEAPGAVSEVAQLASEFNRLLARLEESVTAMKQFTADASHELRTPISILRTGLEVALRQERTADQYRELLEENLAEIERVQRIVEGLLTLARADAEGAPEPSTEVVDLSSIIAGAVASIRAAATEKGVALETAIGDGVRVRGNVDLLRLLVMNLLDNAVKFTGPGKSVRVELEENAEGPLLRVSDQGVGVPESDRAHVFDRFFRGGRARASGSGAGGLGLSVVQWVAEAHGGTARLAPADGPGARFEVSLPPFI